MRSRLRGILYFLATIAAVVVTLKLLSWLPLVLQKETLRAYNSVEEVRSKLNIRDLRVPTYFPQTITWPPAMILAQTKPYPAVVMVFNRAGKKEPALVVSQAASDAFPGNVFIPFGSIKERVDYRLKDRKAVLEVGACTGNEPCSRLAWTEDASRITLTMISPPFELIRIAESMLH